MWLLLSAGDVVADTTVRVRDTTLTHAVTWRVSAAVVADGATLSGTVVGPGQRPAAYAEVGIPKLQRLSVTDTAGRFHMSAIPPGAYLLQVRRIGYAPLSDTVILSSGERAVRTLALRHVVTLDTVRTIGTQRVNISPGLRGFEDRRKNGQGWFVNDSTLRRYDGQTLSSVLRVVVPGLQIMREGMSAVVASGRDTRASKTALSPRANSVVKGCYSTIYLDGVVLYDINADQNGTISPPDINLFAISDLAGIEYHGPATTPAQFTASACGTLLLWTRDK